MRLKDLLKVLDPLHKVVLLIDYPDSDDKNRYYDGDVVTLMVDVDLLSYQMMYVFNLYYDTDEGKYMVWLLP